MRDINIFMKSVSSYSNGGGKDEIATVEDGRNEMNAHASLFGIFGLKR